MDDLKVTRFIERSITVPRGGLFGDAVRLIFWECDRCAALVTPDGKQAHANFHLAVGK